MSEGMLIAMLIPAAPGTSSKDQPSSGHDATPKTT
jgi:hypothetical protein